MMNIRLVSTTQTQKEFLDTFLNDEVVKMLETQEGLMVYTARVSSPKQENPSYAKLLKYCLKNGHWSVFEMCDMTIEINTSRAIAQQILRHRSFCFQEFSQRYAAVGEGGMEVYSARRQDNKNRQNSIEDLPIDVVEWFKISQEKVWEFSHKIYEEALQKGIAKECARFVLPLNTKTKMYMKGSIRSWIHYLDARTAEGVQKEHRDIALQIRDIFVEHFPVIAEAKEWSE